MKRWLASLFIPTPENSYAPQSLQKAAVVGMFALVLISFTVTNLQSLLWMTSDWMVSTILPAVIVTETNKERASDALPPLTRNATLDAAAKLKAEHMAKNEYFAHYSPDGVSPWYWFSQAGYNFVHAGENLAIHFTDSSEVVEAWMNSPTHRANIMNGNYQEIGIGTAAGEYEGYPTIYVVQLFGTKGAVAGASETPVSPTAPATATPASTATAEPAEEIVESQPAVVDTEMVREEVSVAVTDSTEAPVLASEVSVSEEVTIVPAEPVAVPTNTSEALITVDDETVVTLYSDHLSTTTGGAPASLTPSPELPNFAAAGPVGLLTQPQIVLQLLYAIIGAFVAFSLTLSIMIEIRHQQPLQIAYGCMLLALMGGLMYLHLVLTSGAVIV